MRSSSRTLLTLLPLVPILFLPVVTNIATNSLPASWTPYLWLAWPLSIALAMPIGWAEVRRQQHMRAASSNTSSAFPVWLSEVEGRVIHDVIVRSYSSTDDLLRALGPGSGFSHSPLPDDRVELDEAVWILMREAQNGRHLLGLLQEIIEDRPNAPELREIALVSPGQVLSTGYVPRSIRSAMERLRLG